MSENGNGINNQEGTDDSASNFKYGNKNGVMTFINEQSVFFNLNVCKKINNYEKCACKLKITRNMNTNFGSGFFCYIPSKERVFLITNNHLIDSDFLNNEKELIIYIEEDGEEKEKIINLKSNRVKFTNETLDVTMIEILDEDLIDSYFEVDEDLIKDKEFIGEIVFNLHFPRGGQLKASFGKVTESRKTKTQFIYDAGTDYGSSGSPIVLANGYQIIGIHKGCSQNRDFETKKNLGIYLDKIIKSMPKLPSSENKNIIKCLYNIKSEDVNKEISVYDNKFNIEKNIKEVSIYREDEKRPKIVDGKCKFDKEGKYFIFYQLDNSTNNLCQMFNKCNTLTKVFMPTFSDNKIINMSKMFKDCSSLEGITFPNSFNTKNVMDISELFSSCNSLEKIDLSSFNTENVECMFGMLSSCKSLTKVNLSSFNTKNVLDMSSMFLECQKLREININSFNTEKVEAMSHMFQGCTKLSEINLSNFNTECVSDLSYMFKDCISLKKLNISSFKVDKVFNMRNMFENCEAIKDIDLSAFKLNNLTKTRDMFYGCNSLETIGNCKDKKILQEYSKKNRK